VYGVVIRSKATVEAVRPVGQKYIFFPRLSLSSPMHPRHLDELRSKNLVTEAQYDALAPIVTRKIVSVFYELRSLLYLGILLFTTGVGILIYENIGELGHVLSIIALFILTAVCLIYSFRHAPAFSPDKTKSPTPYFDYVVLLGCLLFISALTYLQIQYAVFDDGMGMTTLVTALFFFFAAYRFDHIGILSLAITALASFWGISTSPQKWYSNDFFSDSNLHITALIFSAALATVAAVLARRGIKQHFTFTYMNICCLMFLIAALTGVFIEYQWSGFYLVLLYAGCGVTVYSANQRKSFLFLLYAFVAAYIGTTWLLSDIIFASSLGFIYFFASGGGFIFFVIRFKNYFKRAE